MTQAIDLRSDTVTRPSETMLKAMMQAKVGDDVFGDDPTVNKLQDFAAELFGMEAALYCPSGTMTNQIAIKVHTQPGDEVICDEGSHVYRYEGGGMMANSGCSVRLIRGDRGRFTAEQLVMEINPDNEHYPVSRLVVVENTQNRGGGSIWDFDELRRIKKMCVEKELGFHLDGARLFNALAETGESPSEYGKLFDSISICLSKGLGAPVGSLLLGSKEFIYHAHRARKSFGGGMRQAGYIAAAGHYALQNNIVRLTEDHARARKLGIALEKLDMVDEVLPVDTNIVVARINKSIDSEALLKALEKRGLLAVGFGHQTIRFVTHLNISDEDMEQAVTILRNTSL